MRHPVNTVRVGGATLRPRNTVPFAVAVAAVAAFSFLSGGYILGRSTPVAIACLGLAAVWVWFLQRRSRSSLLLLAALGSFGVFAVWTGLSVLWSFGPDLTWVAFNLTAFYLAVLAVLGLTSVRGLQLRTAGYGYLAVATAVGVYAFLGKATPDLVTHAHTYARLDSPVGYWNVLALMMIMGLCVGLSLAGDRHAHPLWRTVAAAVSVPMAFTFFFTYSRGGWIALGVALLLYFAFTTTRLASLLSLVAVVAPVSLVLWRLRGLDTVFTETTDDALRALQGGVLLRWSVAAVLATVGIQLAVAMVHRSLRWSRWSTVAAGAAVLAVIGIVAVGGSGRYVQTHGGVSWVKDSLHALVTDASTDGGGNAAGRLTTLTTNGRIDLWREAARQARFNRDVGTGAGTFPFTHYRFREMGGVVKHAHSQWFNVLSELGVVGLVLFIVAMVLCVAAMVGNPFSRRRDPLHPLLVAMQAGVIAFFVHITWDWDWDMAAIGTLVFVFIAASASYRMTRAADERRRLRRAGTTGAEPAPGLEETHRGDGRTPSEAAAAGDPSAARAAAIPGAEAPNDEAAAPSRRDEDAAPPRRAVRRRASWAPRVVASTALVLLALSWMPPYLAGRAENAALAAASDGEVASALEHARRAARLDPLAVSPLLTEVTLLQQLGRNREALETVQAAIRLQPANYETWYQLGLLQLKALGREKAAKAAFKRALALNPADAGSRSELEVIGD